MTNYLKAFASVFPKKKHIWYNYRPLTSEEKRVRREIKVADGIKASACMEGRIKGIKKI